jgi:hypothetical protein
MALARLVPAVRNVSAVVDEPDLDELLRVRCFGEASPCPDRPSPVSSGAPRLVIDRVRFEADGEPSEEMRLIRIRTEPVEEAGEGGSGMECQAGKRCARNGKERSAWSVVERGGARIVVGSAWKRLIIGWSRL